MVHAQGLWRLQTFWWGIDIANISSALSSASVTALKIQKTAIVTLKKTLPLCRWHIRRGECNIWFPPWRSQQSLEPEQLLWDTQPLQQVRRVTAENSQWDRELFMCNFVCLRESQRAKYKCADPSMKRPTAKLGRTENSRMDPSTST